MDCRQERNNSSGLQDKIFHKFWKRPLCVCKCFSSLFIHWVNHVYIHWSAIHRKKVGVSDAALFQSKWIRNEGNRAQKPLRKRSNTRNFKGFHFDPFFQKFLGDEKTRHGDTFLKFFCTTPTKVGIYVEGAIREEKKSSFSSFSLDSYGFWLVFVSNIGMKNLCGSQTGRRRLGVLILWLVRLFASVIQWAEVHLTECQAALQLRPHLWGLLGTFAFEQVLISLLMV